MTAQLQLALDDITYTAAVELLHLVEGYIDIVEVGTPLMMRYGMAVVADLKRNFPQLDLLCDTKIMDAAAMETRLAFNAGADYVTVLAVTDDSSIAECVRTANDVGRKIMADMICVPDLPRRANELHEAGVHVIAVHTGVDQQARGRTPLDDLQTLTTSVPSAAVAVAGGIDLDTASSYLAHDPAILIIGSGITQAADPAATTRDLRRMIEGANR
ncbi:MAG: 3-hexulose-6-phosphate synthase [Mycobacterium sp.]